MPLNPRNLSKKKKNIKIVRPYLHPTNFHGKRPKGSNVEHISLFSSPACDYQLNGRWAMGAGECVSKFRHWKRAGRKNPQATKDRGVLKGEWVG